jgi:hypothetical protein
MSRFTNNESIVYFNATLTNSNQLNYNSIPCEFNQVFDNSLIENPKDYDIAVTRFCLSSQSIPFFACPIQLNQPDPNLTPYGISLSYFNAAGEGVTMDDYSYLSWEDSNGILPPIPVYPAGDIKVQLLQNGYYFSYSRQDFINMFNIGMCKALIKLRQLFLTAYPASTDPPPQVGQQYPFTLGYQPIPALGSTRYAQPQYVVPFLSWDDSVGKFKLAIWPEFYCNAGNQITGVKIFLNNMLFQLLQFPSQTNQYENPDNKLNAYQIIVPNNPFNFFLPPYATTNPITMYNYLSYCYSDHDTSGCFSPLQRIIFTSNTLPTKQENIQPETDFATTLNPSANSTIVGQKTLVDFEPDMFSTNTTNRDFIQFNQSVNNSRAIGLQNSIVDIKQIDIKVWWSDFNNNLYPIVLYAGNRFDIKIAFIPRSYLKGNF